MYFPHRKKIYKNWKPNRPEISNNFKSVNLFVIMMSFIGVYFYKNSLCCTELHSNNETEDVANAQQFIASPIERRKCVVSVYARRTEHTEKNNNWVDERENTRLIVAVVHLRLISFWQIVSAHGTRSIAVVSFPLAFVFAFRYHRAQHIVQFWQPSIANFNWSNIFVCSSCARRW